MRMALTLAAVALAACAAIAAPAGTASAATSAVETIGLLEAEGYTVSIDRVGSGPLDTCVVTSIRNPKTVIRFIRVEGHGPHDESVLVPVIVSKTIQVSLYCAT